MGSLKKRSPRASPAKSSKGFPIHTSNRYSCDHLATISPNTSVQTSRQLPMHNYAVNADDTEDTPNRKITRPARSNRRPYVYQSPPPEINVLSPYSRQLVPPISIRYSKPINQIFSKRINASKPVPGKLLGLSMDAKSVGNSVARLRKVDYSDQRGAYMPSPESDDDDSDDERYSSSTWKRPSQGDHPRISNL